MNLEKSLMIASHLALCGHAIKNLQDKLPLEPREQDWVFHLYDMDYTQPYKEHRGTISFLLFKEDSQLAVILFGLSDNIKNNQVSQENWDFILNGLIKYRRHLLSIPHCECD